MTSHPKLINLLMRMFGADDWLRWLRNEYGVDLVVEAPAKDAKPAAIFAESVVALDQHGHIDEDFFARLIAARPKRAKEIKSVQDSWTIDLPQQSAVPTVTDKRRRQLVVRSLGMYGISAVLGALATLFILQTETCDRSSGVLDGESERILFFDCRESLLNLENDLEIVTNIEDLRRLAEQHAAACNPFITYINRKLGRP